MALGGIFGFLVCVTSSGLLVTGLNWQLTLSIIVDTNVVLAILELLRLFCMGTASCTEVPLVSDKLEETLGHLDV